MSRLTERQLDDPWTDPRGRADRVRDAVDELRDAGLTHREHDVLRGLHSRLTGDERDIVERLVAATEPRRP